jgi:hypothetical protein
MQTPDTICRNGTQLSNAALDPTSVQAARQFPLGLHPSSPRRASRNNHPLGEREVARLEPQTGQGGVTMVQIFYASTLSLSDLQMVTVVTNVTFAQLTWPRDQERIATDSPHRFPCLYRGFRTFSWLPREIHILQRGFSTYVRKKYPPTDLRRSDVDGRRTSGCLSFSPARGGSGTKPARTNL